jgi:N-acyl-D-aspartate/D-glutamate deacylase
MRTVDVVIRHGEMFDGSGAASWEGGLAIEGDRIALVGDVRDVRGRLEIDARGLAVAPGFINMLSWATESLLVDGRSVSDLRQGVTLEVFGEGTSMGPLTPEMRERMVAEQGDLRFDVEWTTLAEYLAHLERLGISTNVASFVGATSVRIHELGYADRAPTAAELDQIRALVRDAMADGALGVGSSLIYAPAFYAETDELVALASEAARAGGMYISHIRSEGAGLLEGIDEFLEIGRRSGGRSEIYHFKGLGAAGIAAFPEALARVEQARAAGQHITADVYPYIAAATGLDAAMPPWVQEGGLLAWIERLRDPATRARVAAEMCATDARWENQILLSGGPDGVLLTGFKNDRLKPLTGRTLASVAAERGVSPEDAAIDLVIEDESRVATIYFNQSEDVLRTVLALPWVSIGSDEASVAPEGTFLRSNPHPRAYGSFARFLGRYVRDDGLVGLSEGIRRLTSLPAMNLGLDGRGSLDAGAYGDVVVFDPAKIEDHATFERPHRFATGVEHMFVNGFAALLDGEITNERPGRALRRAARGD